MERGAYHGFIGKDIFLGEPTPDCLKNMKLYSRDVRKQFKLTNKLRKGITIILSSKEIKGQMDILSQVMNDLLEENLDLSYDDIVAALGTPKKYVRRSLKYLVMPF